MANLEKINLHINAKNKAKGVLNSVKKQIIAVGAAYLGWKVATTLLGDSIKAAVHTNKVYNDLSASVERHGMVWENVEKSLRSYTDTMQTATGVSDELIAKGLQAFIDFGADTVGAMDSMNVALDLAAGSNIELTAAVDLLSKASVGYTGTLSRYGIIIDQAIPASDRFAEAINQINQKFGGAAAARMETSAGKISLLSEKFGDFQETLGKFVIPALDLAVAGLTNFLDLLAGSQGAIAITEQDVKAKTRLAEQLEVLRQKYDDGSLSLEEFNLQSKILSEGGTIVAGVIQLTADEMLKELTATDNLAVGWDSHNRAIGDATTAGIKMSENLGLQAQEAQALADAMKKVEERIAAALKLAAEPIDLRGDEIVDRMNQRLENLGKTSDKQITRTVNLGKELLIVGKVGEGAMKDIDMGAKAALEGFETFGMEVERVLQESLVDSTLSATTQMINSLQLLSTQSHGFFKQMGVNFANEFIRRATTALITSGLLRIFTAIFSGGTSEIVNIAGGFTGGGLAPPVIGGGDFGGGTESLQFSINSRQTNITQDDRNLTGRSLVQFR